MTSSSHGNFPALAEAEFQRLVEELLEQQGLKLEEVLMQPPLFKPSRQPLHGTLEQLLQRDRTTTTKETLRYSQVGVVGSPSTIKD